MKHWYNLVFVAVCAGVLAVLLLAPDATTPRLPVDATHESPREYARCPQCHGADSAVAMPATGDKPHFRPDGSLRGEFVKCYMCHKPREG